MKAPFRDKDALLPDAVKKDIDQFNVFPLDAYIGVHPQPWPYSRRDYYKISLVLGRNVYHYANRSIETKPPALCFGNPLIPYSVEQLDPLHQSGYCCVFTAAFFEGLGVLQDYPVFKPGGDPVYQLNAGEKEEIAGIFARMQAEINSNYPYKYDVLRAIVLELLHRAPKLQPAEAFTQQGSDRISACFRELLERQFPVRPNPPRAILRAPAEFARCLGVSVAQLNRALKTEQDKSTSACITDRLLQEAQGLLKHTDWPIADIATALGFRAPAEFIRFFEENARQSLRAFRL
ncbi:helix-turn-helix domain-containing protein [Chitinophaga agrisoli]|uniref:Helix-turn-helix domain-containing protein n=1 Tax=Chitinophaga agrisoli TaxID=2607653 RepID=A0A5B2VLD1_9BACT|nr:helix-turn-helix domain-containing protein [Chitinophaga agrisoli]KAA2239518.1 helix-turn-helix domain-containing protein [Chitinophaga agrisoli]